MRVWILPVLASIFVLLSILTLSSIAPTYASRQLIFVLVSGGLFFAASRVPFQEWFKFRTVSYIFACVFLLIPFIFSLSTRNTARWIPVGDWFAIQPSQFTLPLVSFLLLWHVTKAKRYTWQFFLKFFGLLLLPAVLILMGPDLDTTFVLIVTLSSLLFFVPIPWKVFAGFGVLGIIVVACTWLFILEPYQKARVTSFLSSGEDMQGANYNAKQALIAVGAGQFAGRGLGQGIQSHLQFLPEKHTDFIFSSLAEEYGYIGTSIVLALYTLLVTFLLWASTRVEELEEKLFLVLAALLFFLQASININMNIGLIPVTGITLPMLSYGGSSLLGISLLLGIAQSIINHSQKKTLLHIK